MSKFPVTWSLCDQFRDSSDGIIPKSGFRIEVRSTALVTEEKNDETVKKNRLVEPSAGERFQQALWCKPWPICETLEGQNFVR